VQLSVVVDVVQSAYVVVTDLEYDLYLVHPEHGPHDPYVHDPYDVPVGHVHD
jgi:hypothetical protein